MLKLRGSRKGEQDAAQECRNRDPFFHAATDNLLFVDIPSHRRVKCGVMAGSGIHALANQYLAASTEERRLLGGCSDCEAFYERVRCGHGLTVLTKALDVKLQSF